MNAQTEQRLREILGSQVFVFGFDTAAAANRTASLKMAEGRKALTFCENGIHYAAWGVTA